jgi:hypothetical protein
MPEAADLNYEPFASNPFGVQATPLDYSHEHAPTSKTYHGITIAVSGAVIGRIQSWDTTGAWARGGEHVYELSSKTWGKPVDYVPARWEGLSIRATVAEMWSKEIEVQTGVKDYGQLNDLIEQSKPFTTHEFWYRGVANYRIWVYRGCWLTDRNETAYAATGNARVIANFQFNYVSRQMVS